MGACMLIRDMQSTHVRMPSRLKQDIDFHAKSNNRSLNAEIVQRLQDSLTARQDHGTKQAPISPYSGELPMIEQQLLNIFRRLTPEKQLALISLFK